MVRTERLAQDVVVVDMGVVCALGSTWPGVLRALQRGDSGLVFDDLQGYPSAVGRVQEDVPQHGPNGQALDRGVGLALACAQQLQPLPALDPARMAVFWGVGLAGAHLLEHTYAGLGTDLGKAHTPPWLVPMVMPNAAASLLAMRLGLQGGAWTQASACASSAMALGQALHAIRAGALDLAVAGGSDAMLTPGMCRAWARMRVLARTTPAQAPAACRPFDAARKGLALAEGAACLVLMSGRMARAHARTPLARLLGFGHSCDAHDLTAPLAAGQAQAMRLALQDANTAPAQLRYVCAHATGTPLGDRTELQALQAVFGGQVPTCAVASLKSVLGHTLGASGALACAMTVAMLATQWWAPTVHLQSPDAAWADWCLPTPAQPAPNGVGLAMVNAFGFGGSNASLVLAPAAQGS